MGATVPGAAPGPVAITATVAAAVGRWSAEGGPEGRTVEPGDLREAVFAHPTSNLVVLAVDTSGSMGATDRLAAARAATLSLLVDAYQRRDRVAVVTFGGRAAETVLRPTGSTEIARARLESLATGGTTPLAAGIRHALEVASAPRESAYRPLLVVVSDGRATWAEGGEDPVRASLRAAEEVRRSGVAALVVDCERGKVRLGLAAPLAVALGARLVSAEGRRVDGELIAEAARTALI